MSNKNMLRLFTLSCICLLCCSCENTKSDSDIYVDKLVYNKSDSTLFTGVLETENSTLEMRFNEGKPCGDWIETESTGGLVQKGTFETENLKLNSLKRELSDKLYLIDFWQEGELNNTTYLTISIIEEDSFFSSNNENRMKDYLKTLFERSTHDLLNVKCRGIYLEFINAVYQWDKSCYLYFDSNSKIIEFDKYGSW